MGMPQFRSIDEDIAMEHQLHVDRTQPVCHMSLPPMSSLLHNPVAYCGI